jgi:predicted metal-dependent hydrolase
MQVEVVRSARRNRTVALRPTANGVRISIPARATQEEEAEYVRRLLRQYERKRNKNDVSLSERAKILAGRYGLERPTSIEWSDRQKTRWGSCSVQSGAIRISTEVKGFPTWVIDYVVMHELAHLSYAGHGARFWALVERYPKTERAIGFLIAKGLESSEPDSESESGGSVEVDEQDGEPTADTSSPTMFG